MLTGCATTLPEKAEVEYSIDSAAGPEIIHPNEESLDQKVFEIKINEIRAKAHKYIIAELTRIALIDKAENLLKEQQHYYLSNENKPQKTGVVTMFITALGLGAIKATSKSKIEVGEKQYKAGFDIDFGAEDGPYVLSSIALVCPLTYILAYYLGKKIGEGYKSVEIKPEFREELHKIINLYNNELVDQVHG